MWFYVYVLSNKSHRTYIGVTRDLLRRLREHGEKRGSVFTARYRFTRLVYFEQFTDVRAAIAREKELKGWRRQKKTELIQRYNPRWLDLTHLVTDVR